MTDEQIERLLDVLETTTITYDGDKIETLSSGLHAIAVSIDRLATAISETAGGPWPQELARQLYEYGVGRQ